MARALSEMVKQAATSPRGSTSPILIPWGTAVPGAMRPRTTPANGAAMTCPATSPMISPSRTRSPISLVQAATPATGARSTRSAAFATDQAGRAGVGFGRPVPDDAAEAVAAVGLDDGVAVDAGGIAGAEGDNQGGLTDGGIDVAFRHSGIDDGRRTTDDGRAVRGLWLVVCRL